MAYTLKDQLFFTDSESVSWPKGHKRSNLGQIVELGSNQEEESKCIQYTYVSTTNFLKNSDLIFFKLN